MNLLHWRCFFVFVGTFVIALPWCPAAEPVVRSESPQETTRRHERVAQRRSAPHVICHRGASEFAHENTLEAFRATFELGGDGNEIDIRATRDGVLVCFHDDMLDQRLEAYGDVSEVDWEELQRYRFRNPGRFGKQCRIPTLIEVFELHRRYGGLMHLDIKRPGLDQAISSLLDRMDMWDQVAYCNTETGGIILTDARLKLCRYKGGLYADRGEVFPDAIAAVLAKPGDGVIVDDPRGVIVSLGRKLGRVSNEPVAPRPPNVIEPRHSASEAALLAELRNVDDWNQIAVTPDEMRRSGHRIRARAMTADAIWRRGGGTTELMDALAERARNRSLHKEWMFHGLDGAAAIRTLILLRGRNAVETARFVLWRDDPALDPVIDPRWSNPRSWTDFRVKMVVFPALEHCPGPATEQLCRDYLALSDGHAHQLGPAQFEQAGKTLLSVSPTVETAAELLSHRLQVVRGRAILDCLANGDSPWARAALEQHAPHALEYIP